MIRIKKISQNDLAVIDELHLIDRGEESVATSNSEILTVGGEK